MIIRNETESDFEALGAKGCALVGDPNYYKALGFRNLPHLILEGVPPENFLVLSFDDSGAHGVVVFHPGFAATE
jgi:putative acetyltransferase